eukprot:Tbor_TRINITY_DN4036_c0_g1::TRINITY_DN4036_c0_g1_i1::g.11683::m.11683
MFYFAIPLIRGGVPCLTPKQVDDIVTEPQERVLVMSYFDVHTGLTGCKATKLSYAQFCGLNAASLPSNTRMNELPYNVIMTIRSSWQGAHACGITTDKSICGENDAGRVSLTVDAWKAAVDILKPNYAAPLHTSLPIPEQQLASMARASEEGPSQSKKARTAYYRNERWETQCNLALVSNGGNQGNAAQLIKISSLPPNQHKQEEYIYQQHSLPLTCVLAETVNMGESPGQRLAFLSETVRKFTSGSNQQTLLISVAETIPSIFIAYLGGVTHIDCNLPFLLAKGGRMLQLHQLIQYILTICQVGNCSMPDLQAIDKEGCDVPPQDMIIDLNDAKFALDHSPLGAPSSLYKPSASISQEHGFTPKTAKQCVCYSCKRHTKSYVHHLLAVQEMNAETLLVIHNMSEIVCLCRALRTMKEMGLHMKAVGILQLFFHS